MPIFEYRCQDCGGDFEEIVFRDDESVPCPKCGSVKTGKLMSCCRHKTAGGGDGGGVETPSSGGSSSSCAGCSGGSCATCH